MKGKLIVIEGLDGSGKATQSILLKKSLEQKKQNVTHISFPDYKEPSSALVKMYLNSEFGSDPSDVNAYAASSFFAVDRYASYKKFWQKNYDNNGIIICDRYVTSNAVYQMAKMQEELWEGYLNWLYDYEYDKLGLPRPDYVIYLRVPIEVSQVLMNGRYGNNSDEKDLHEKNTVFLKKCQRAAEYVCNRDGWTVINCSESSTIRSIDHIHNDIIKTLESKDIYINR